MSSLIFYTDAGQALVATDTLAVEPSGKPMMFSSKAFYLPHLKTIIAGTGVGMFSGDWAMAVNNRMVVAGIKNLDHHTPQALRERWRKYILEYELSAKMTTTVYHFGFGEDDQVVCAYAYRSTSEFQTEKLGYGFGLKPECSLPLEGSLLNALPAMMNEQRQNQLARPEHERLHIGGECIAMHLTKDTCQTFRVFQFDDYPLQLQAAFRNHQSGIASFGQ
jgi:hypothetical protein